MRAYCESTRLEAGARRPCANTLRDTMVSINGCLAGSASSESFEIRWVVRATRLRDESFRDIARPGTDGLVRME